MKMNQCKRFQRVVQTLEHQDKMIHKIAIQSPKEDNPAEEVRQVRNIISHQLLNSIMIDKLNNRRAQMIDQIINKDQYYVGSNHQ